MLSELSYLNSNIALTLGYLNPALNNSAQDYVHQDDHTQPTLLNDSWVQTVHAVKYVMISYDGYLPGATLLTLSLTECLMEFCKATLTFESMHESYDVTIQMNVLRLYFHMMPFVSQNCRK